MKSNQRTHHRRVACSPQVVEEALAEWENRMFWAEVQRAFAATPESAQLRAERALWDRTVADGLEAPARPKAARRTKRNK